MKKLPERKSNRLKNFDYSSNGAYFITICTRDKRHLLGDIVGDADPGVPQNIGDAGPGEMQNVGDAEVGVPQNPSVPHMKYTKYGEIADKYIRSIESSYENVSVVHYVIMPNHVHMILVLHDLPKNPGGTPRSSSPTTVGRVIGAFKRFTNMEAGEQIWQRSFYDHVIREERDYEEIWKYIEENPIKWNTDEYY